MYPSLRDICRIYGQLHSGLTKSCFVSFIIFLSLISVNAEMKTTATKNVTFMYQTLFNVLFVQDLPFIQRIRVKDYVVIDGYAIGSSG